MRFVREGMVVRQTVLWGGDRRTQTGGGGGKQDASLDRGLWWGKVAVETDAGPVIGGGWIERFGFSFRVGDRVDLLRVGG